MSHNENNLHHKKLKKHGKEPTPERRQKCVVHVCAPLCALVCKKKRGHEIIQLKLERAEQALLKSLPSLDQCFMCMLRTEKV